MSEFTTAFLLTVFMLSATAAILTAFITYKKKGKWKLLDDFGIRAAIATIAIGGFVVAVLYSLIAMQLPSALIEKVALEDAAGAAALIDRMQAAQSANLELIKDTFTPIVIAIVAFYFATSASLTALGLKKEEKEEVEENLVSIENATIETKEPNKVKLTVRNRGKGEITVDKVYFDDKPAKQLPKSYKIPPESTVDIPVEKPEGAAKKSNVKVATVKGVISEPHPIPLKEAD